MNCSQEIKMNREAGTPALLRFKPEELPAGCRITSVINMIIRVRARPPFPCLMPGLDINRSRHRPFIIYHRSEYYLNLSEKYENTNNELERY